MMKSKLCVDAIERQAMKKVMNGLLQTVFPVFVLIVLSHVTSSFTATTSTSLSNQIKSTNSLIFHSGMHSKLQIQRRHKKLCAVKRKRRRKQESSEDEIESTNTLDELPDFDLNDDTVTDGQKATKQKVVTRPATTVESMEMIEISTNKPLRSIQELLSDRSLEQKFKFDEDDIDTSLPDLAPISRTTSLLSTVDSTACLSTGSRKKERQQEAIRLAKLAAEKEKEEKDRQDLLNMLPGIRDEKGKISPVKILESGTWACIYMLVAWEVYINTPLFDRAAPMTPVVY